jgi:hypothetical protein
MRTRAEHVSTSRVSKAPSGRHRAPRRPRRVIATQLGSLLTAVLLVASVLTGVTVAVTPGIAQAEITEPTICSLEGGYSSSDRPQSGGPGDFHLFYGSWRCYEAGTLGEPWSVSLSTTVDVAGCPAAPVIAADLYGYSYSGSKFLDGSVSGYLVATNLLHLSGTVMSDAGLRSISLALSMTNVDLCRDRSLGLANGTMTLDADPDSLLAQVPPVPPVPPVPDPVGVLEPILTGTGLVQSPDIGHESAKCQTQPGSQQVTDTTAEGARTLVYTSKPTATEVNVCFRVEATAASSGYGGRVGIIPAAPGVSDTPGVPSSDGLGSTCTTTTPNAVPGTHPMVSGSTVGVPYAFDSYSNGASTAWVCVRVGSNVNVRVVVPVAAPTVTGVPPSYLVTFYPDAGTL